MDEPSRVKRVKTVPPTVAAPMSSKWSSCSSFMDLEEVRVDKRKEMMIALLAEQMESYKKQIATITQDISTEPCQIEL